jgi:molybdopterin molybdotransferase
LPDFSPTQSTEPPISVADAQSRVLDAVRPFDIERVALVDALGRVLREDIVAEWDVPASDNSAMDGYAVRSSDLAGASDGSPVGLNVVADVPAGTEAAVRVEPGQAARIMTGAPLPPGADSIAQVEITDGGSDVVRIFREVKPGANVRRRAEDIEGGRLVLDSGARIGSGEIGVLATVGRGEVAVARRPTVAILSTGSELVDPGVRPGPGQVTNSNAFALAALVRELGGDPHVVGRVADSLEATVDALRDALACDIVLTSGGVSVGAYDYVKDAVRAIGAETKFWRVAMKPGKPILFAVGADRLIFGLPGNPVSSMVGFHLFVGPAIRKGLGLSSGWRPPVVRARAGAAMKSKGDRLTFLRVRVRSEDGALVAYPMKLQGSGVTSSMIAANGLATVPQGTTAVDEGSTVEVVLIGPLESTA